MKTFNEICKNVSGQPRNYQLTILDHHVPPQPQSISFWETEEIAREAAEEIINDARDLGYHRGFLYEIKFIG